nr:phage tail tape measure protein [Streptococcus chenjunshii]
MFIELGLDTSKFSSDVNGAKRAVNFFKAETKALDSALKGNGNNVNLLQTKYKSLQQTIDAQKKVLTGLKANFDELEPGTAKWEAAAVQIERENAKLQDLEGQLQAVSKAMRDAASQSGFTGWLQSSGKKVDEFGQKLKTAGDNLKWVSAGMAAGAGFAIKSASDFESAFTGVKKTVDEVKDSNGNVTYSYEQLAQGIRNMAKEIPASTTEIAAVAEAAGQLGIKTEDVLAFTRVMIDMGESTNLSANDAAQALAKFANITQMSPSKYQNLGSAIVALGNNFATTESDIVNMGLRLAGTGHLVGLTEPQIMGLATAMSSVGIEAEAGGSAFSKVMQKINSDVMSGGGNLEKFAETAGMSASQFAEVWKKDPQQAITDFVKGLGKIKDGGGDVTGALKEMGINSVRELDTMQRLAGAGDLLSKSFETANKGFKENTALTKEAEKRYETFQSKLKIFKNKLNDIGIELGGPLMQAASDALDAMKPLFKTIENMAKAYSNASPEMKRFIAYMVAGTAAASPLLKILGSTTSGVGKLMNGVGKLAGGLKGLMAVKDLAPAMGAVTTEATGLTSAVGLLGNPVTWGVLLGGGALLAITAWSEHAREAKNRTQEWGTEVSKTQANELSEFKDKVDETSRAMEGFGTGGTQNVNDVKKAFKELADEITALTDEKLAKDLKLAEKWGLSDEQKQAMIDNANQTKENVQRMSDEVIEIYKNASDNNRKLSAEEKEIILNNQKELISKQLEMMDLSKKERTAIQKAMNGELDELNETQLNKALSTTQDWLKKENKLYKDAKDELKQLHKDGGLSDKAYKEELEKLEADHLAKMEAYGDKYMDLRKKIAEVTGNLDNSGYWTTVEQDMEKLGLSFDDMQKKLEGFADAADNTSGLVAKSVANMSDEMRAANMHWNGLVLDPKTGEIKTNAQDEIQKALEAENGWENLKFDLKNANLETNAKIAIGEALVATGQWDSLSPKDKKLITDNKPTLKALMSSKDMLKQWNGLPVEVKKILAENESFLNDADAAKKALDTWNLLQPQQKELLAKDMTSGDVDKAQQAINSLTGKSVIIDADNQTEQGALEAGITVNGVKQEVPTSINATDNTGAAASSANKSVNSPKQNTPVKLLASNLTKDAVDKATKSVNSVKDKTVTINARDNASSVIANIASSLTNLSSQLISIGASVIANATGTNYHPGGLAMVNDQKGPMYKEMVTLPSGQSFIPEGRDVVLPLPKGSKVLKASRTRDLMSRLGVSKYQNGIGIPEDAKFLKDLERTDRNVTVVSGDNQGNDEVIRLLRQMLLVLNKKDKNGTQAIYMDKRKVGEILKEEMQRAETQAKRLEGDRAWAL